MRGLFVTGTDTGVGKTIVSAAVLAAMRAAGERVAAYKPVVTGLDEFADPSEQHLWPADHELLAAVAGMDPAVVSPIAYGPAVSPHLAAELAGERILLDELLEGARAALAAGAPDSQGTLVVEGVGGLLVPIGDGLTVCDLVAALGLPVIIAARPGLGTINHTLLTLRVARERGLDVRSGVLTPWRERPDRMESSNRETIAGLGEIEVTTLGFVDSPDRDALARAASDLPWRRWISAGEP